jgi:hypothetical protein
VVVCVCVCVCVCQREIDSEIEKRNEIEVVGNWIIIRNNNALAVNYCSYLSQHNLKIIETEINLF